MAKWVPDSNLDLQLTDIALANEEVICSQQPLTFYNAHWPSMWVAETAYIVGDVVHPPTGNGFVYECITGGTSGVGEPAWGTSQDAEFSDGTVTWKTHVSYALANTALVSGDKVIADGTGEDTGRVLTIGEKVGIVVHKSGEVTHTALLDNSEEKIKLVTLGSTTTVGDNDVVAGKAIIFQSFKVKSPDPV